MAVDYDGALASQLQIKTLKLALNFTIEMPSGHFSHGASDENMRRVEGHKRLLRAEAEPGHQKPTLSLTRGERKRDIHNTFSYNNQLIVLIYKKAGKRS